MSCPIYRVTRRDQDQHRFPPYQDLPQHCLVNCKGVYRIPSILEREYMMGLPAGYTQMCVPKTQRKKAEYSDKRLSLVGNGWSVPVVVWLLRQLLGPRGLCPALSPSAVLGRLDLEGNPYIQSRLMRSPLRPDQSQTKRPAQALTNQLGRLVSTKGADLMLNSTPDEVQGHQRLRHTINPKMWKW